MLMVHYEAISCAKPDEVGGQPEIVGGVSECDVQVCHCIEVIL
jgi:hypothetical protein